jgi:thiamine biosynthesis lipoprotein
VDEGRNVTEPEDRQGRLWTVLGIIFVAVFAVVVVLRLLGVLWLEKYEAWPKGIMGTDTELVAVASPWHQDEARAALGAAERELRQVEALMSVHLEATEISLLNQAPVGEVVELSPATLEVLRRARDFAAASDGAFDVTVAPLLNAWARAGREKRMPTEAELQAARQAVGWEHFELTESGARRLRADAKIDLGGIAKKHGIDEAMRAMRGRNIDGALVNVGGDIRVWGAPPTRREKWRISVRDPFNQAATMATVEIEAGSVCTSGNYERYVMIEGRRRSHIVDPRTGEPADMVPSVTVVGPTALEAGLWATALSVLGADGLELMKAENPELEAMIVTGSDDDFTLVVTAGLRRYLMGVAPQYEEQLTVADLPAPGDSAEAASAPGNGAAR